MPNTLKYAAIISLAAILAVALVAGISGVDFGYHWDEVHKIDNIARSIETGTFLPDWYVYPSVIYDLMLVSLVPDAAKLYLERDGGKATLLRIVRGHGFTLRIRAIFIIVTSLSILWVYLTVSEWRGSRGAALLAAALVGLSWEVSYHARWIAPDALMMQFGALTMLILFHYLRRKTKIWLILSAVAAGIACGTKYPGGLLLAPVLAAAFFYPPGGISRRSSVRITCALLLVFCLTYLITTPGTVLQPVRFYGDVSYEMRHYSTYGHGGHTVAPGLQHLNLIVTFLCMAALSHYAPISCFFFIMSLVGVVTLARRDGKKTAIFLLFPLLYIAVFSVQRVMMVRNYLVLIPFLAVLSSFGCVSLYGCLRPRVLRILFSSAVTAMLLLNACWILSAAHSITAKSVRRDLERLARYVDRRPGMLFLLSGPVADDLAAFDGKARPNVTKDVSRKAEAAVFYSTEVGDWKRWTAYKYNYTWTWFGPREVNFNYYPHWAYMKESSKRIVVMPCRSARKLGVFDGGTKEEPLQKDAIPGAGKY